MSTPISPLPQQSFAEFAPETPAHLSSIDPDNPPWGIISAVLMWLASIFVLGLIPFFGVYSYLAYRGISATPEAFNRAVTVDPQGILVSIVSVIPSHLVTIALAWAFITGFGSRPFWQTLGWRFGQRFGLWTSAGLSILLFMLGGVILRFVGGAETDIDNIITSSTPARFTTAFLATATAPLVEELIYRGVLYPALRRAMGAALAIIGVSALFALVHAWQYRNNLGVIVTITILSFTLTYVRARTGRLLPCFIIHLVFNGIQSVFIVLQYFYPQLSDPAKSGSLLLAPLLPHTTVLIC
ncbi:MAG TPA: type II CAAX endopeptidase family protein [Pyrinomonadaceae bacterium]